MKVKPSAAASRVAAARAAAKAAKPPPTRKTSEGKSSPTRKTSERKGSPVRKPSVSPAKEISTEEKGQNGVQSAEGEGNALCKEAALENGVEPVAVEEEGSHETDAATRDSAVEGGVCQNEVVQGEGEVRVDGEGGDIGTSEC